MDWNKAKNNIARAEQCEGMLGELEKSKLHVGIVTDGREGRGIWVTEDGHTMHQTPRHALVIYLERTEGAHGTCSNELHGELAGLLRQEVKRLLAQKLETYRANNLKGVVRLMEPSLVSEAVGQPKAPGLGEEPPF